MTFKVLDIFSGIGGFSHALDQIEHNGEKLFETVAFCEIDTNCHKVLNKHWPQVPVFKDVSKLHVTDDTLMCEDDSESGYVDNKIDVICGGFPCQDISTAGKQKGFKDGEGNKTRSGLWSEYKRLIQEIKPRWVIIENVPNLLNLGFGRVVQDLCSIGYDCSWEIISARSIGACHLRKRIWIVAYPNGESIRDDEQWEEIRRQYIQNSREVISGGNGEAGCVESSDTDIYGLDGETISVCTEDEEESNDLTRRSSEEISIANSEGFGLERPVYSGGETGLRRQLSNESSETLLTNPNVQRLEGTEYVRRPECKLQFAGDESSKAHPSYSDNFRFWPSFATEESKQEWWAEATAGLRDWWEVEPNFCRMDDELSDGLDKGAIGNSRPKLTPEKRAKEKARQARIKQLGNSIVPGIARIIGERIKYHEFNAESLL